jgi:hypothetical protein
LLAVVVVVETPQTTLAVVVAVQVELLTVMFLLFLL